MKQTVKTPLYDAIVRHQNRNPLSFHVPGHKQGTGFSDQHLFDTYSNVFSLDLTEITGLDDLHHPEDVIAQSQDLLANFYGADDSFFLVGGSTSGNLAMIIGCFQPGDCVLVQRDIHKSIIHGLRLARVQPVFLAPDVDERSQLSRGLSLETVREALSTYSNIKGIILTTPSYYGWVSPCLRKVITLAHQHGAVVLADEAHGAHFTLNEMFPTSALEAGADVVVQSAHKTLPALTMGAFLHIHRSSKVSVSAVREALSMVQSSSPSYPIMASLDVARAWAESMTEVEKKIIINQLHEWDDMINRIPEIETVSPPGPLEQDPLKSIVKAPFQRSGWDFQSYLEEVGVFTELADHRNVLFVLPLSLSLPIHDTEKKIRAAVQTASLHEPRAHRGQGMESYVFPYPSHTFPDMEAFQQMMGMSEQWNIQSVEGCMAAEDLVPYPPGIPLLMKGERITREHIVALTDWVEAGGKLQGGRIEKNINKVILKISVFSS